MVRIAGDAREDRVETIAEQGPWLFKYWPICPIPRTDVFYNGLLVASWTPREALFAHFLLPTEIGEVLMSIPQRSQAFK